jgi:hypothetical protein
MRLISIGKALMASALFLGGPYASASIVFQDNFLSGAKPDWGNERGSWRVPTSSKAYDATHPNNNPVTYTSVTTHSNLTDFTVRVTVNDLNDGGVWLRSNFNGGNVNGILLVTGGSIGTSNGFYWHVFHNGSAGSPLQNVSVPGIQGKTVAIRIVVKRNTYRLYMGTSTTPISTLVDNTYTSGSAGLYDFSPTNGATSPRGETFSRFSISVP